MPDHKRNIPSTKTCPKCRQKDVVFYSHSRSKFEHLLNRTKFLAYYRCHNCGWRGLRFRKIRIKIKPAQLLFYIILIIIITYIASNILKDYLGLSF